MLNRINGHLLTTQRICAGLSVEELSIRAVAARQKHCGSSHDFQLTARDIARIEAGEVKPSGFQLRWLSKGLGCNLADLLTRTQCIRIIETATIPDGELPQVSDEDGHWSTANESVLNILGDK